jgi:hypothetical protein
MITRSAFLPVYKAGHPADLPLNTRNLWPDRSIEERIDAEDTDKLAIAEP